MIKFIKHHIKKIGWIIWILNLFMAAGSSWLFLVRVKLPVIAWICYNPCALSAGIFLIGFAVKKKEILAASVSFLLFYSIAGLIIFGWTRVFIMAQIAHTLMICALIYTASVIYSHKLRKNAAIGFITGLILFCVFLPLQQKYVKEHQAFAENMGPGMEELITRQKGMF